jgi:hypothetical protein
MSKLGYFLGGAAAGIAGLTAAALLHDHFSSRSSGPSLPQSVGTGDAQSPSEPDAGMTASESETCGEAKAAPFFAAEPSMPDDAVPATA